MNTYQFKTNIACGGCVASVKPHLDGQTAIQSWNVETANPQKVLTVETALQPEEVKALVAQAGYKAELL